ncbi:hypothetical protein [Kitasatospora aureofaciens]|uniref:hypothetical protein n=1 Tax=Kitasatospora aureofaciens TaxID=1894 RepID=UPI00381CD18E
MSTHDHVAQPARSRAWPDPTDEQVGLIARILAPHIHRARAERLAAEQNTSPRIAVERAAA